MKERPRYIAPRELVRNAYLEMCSDRCEVFHASDLKNILGSFTVEDQEFLKNARKKGIVDGGRPKNCGEQVPKETGGYRAKHGEFEYWVTKEHLDLPVPPDYVWPPESRRNPVKKLIEPGLKCSEL
jgi:hypothetical protein